MVNTAYLDFYKAFDLVCHEILLGKLVVLGFIQGRLMRVSAAGKLCQEVEISSGVSPGTSTSLDLW